MVKWSDILVRRPSCVGTLPDSEFQVSSRNLSPTPVSPPNSVGIFPVKEFFSKSKSIVKAVRYPSSVGKLPVKELPFLSSNVTSPSEQVKSALKSAEAFRFRSQKEWVVGRLTRIWCRDRQSSSSF